MKSFRWRLVVAVWATMLVGVARADFVNFESGQVRPIALSPDGSRLFALDTPDARLEIFAVESGGLSHLTSVAVGLEPVAVAARSNTEVWVVNHLSDSVSIVDLSATPPRVTRTLLVGDEPRDIVFAGPMVDGSFTRAFVTSARRGQNSPLASMLSTPSTARALVWVFDTRDLGSAFGGEPEAILELFGDTPRALAASADGATVYAAVFHSGNETTAISEGAVCNGGASVGACDVDGVTVAGGLAGGKVPGGLPAPNQNREGIPGPETGLIVRLNRASGQWQDELGRNWNNAVRFDLPDYDVFRIDALADAPQQTAEYAHVGTVLFNLLVNPSNGHVYVSNTEAHNEVRFEGPGTSASTVRGDLHQARVTVISGDEVQPRHLNKHLAALPQGYRTTPMPAAARANSLAIPTAMALASDGTLYVAAFGSSRVGRFSAAAIEDDSFTPDAATHIEVSGGGPSGLALDEANGRLYVLTRFDNAVKVIDTAAGREIALVRLHNPEPASVKNGRRFLYDAHLSSSNGEASCASCHVFGDFDSLAWDLGNPDDLVRLSFNPAGPIGSQQAFHPLKGPMTTQTLRGIATHGPMHWRGDRTGAQSPNDPSALDAKLAFEAFNVAFDGLLGRDEGELSSEQMSSFADFALSIALPPNPIRRLSNELTPAEELGRDIYMNRPGTDGIASCNGCHTLDPANGFFGSEGKTTFENEPQEFKVASLRNAYQKVGMFGMPEVPFVNLGPAATAHQGPQVRGFGYLHDGSIATVLDFLHASVFGLSEQDRSDLEQFIFAFDTTYAPIVGQQITWSGNDPAAAARVQLLVQRASTPFVLMGAPQARECDLVARAVIAGEDRGYLFSPSASAFVSDRNADAPQSLTELEARADSAGEPITFTCVPPGEGVRLGVDRDGDGFRDRDEVDAGSDPADAEDVPNAGCVGDCDLDGAITVDEIIRGIEIALGNQPLSGCSRLDVDGDGAVVISELLQAVVAALQGCTF